MAEKTKAANRGKKNIIYILAAVLVVLIVSAGIYYFTKAPKQEIAVNNTVAVVEEGFKTHTIDMSPSNFAPNLLTINNGDTVVWMNSDTKKHTVTSSKTGELHSPVILAGGNYTHRFTSTGTFLYHCEVNPDFKGSIVVE